MGKLIGQGTAINFISFMIYEVNDFNCRACKGDVPGPTDNGEALSIVVAGVKFEAVSHFCYLGDMLAQSGGADAAVTARIRIG